MCNITMPHLFEKTVGTRAEVFSGVAEKTSYGQDALFQKDIVHKDGKYMSKYKVEHVPKQLKDWTKAVKKLKIKQKPGEPAVMIKGKLATAARKEFKKLYD